jgi:hypothetical protein
MWRATGAWLVCAAVGACGAEPAPWEGDAGRREDWQARRLEIARPAPSASAVTAAPTSRARTPNRGDPCDAGFRTSGEPRADVVRLGAICGPPERFRRDRDAIEGALAEGGPTVEIALRMEAHRCYRIVAASEPSVADLDVELRSERDVVLASDDDDASFVVVHRRGAVCSERDGDARALFRSGNGKGRFAAEIWSRPDEETALPAAPIDGRGRED